jgi:hypothetical protein
VKEKKSFSRNMNNKNLLLKNKCQIYDTIMAIERMFYMRGWDVSWIKTRLFTDIYDTLPTCVYV